ncbi:MAG: Rho termination factor N-terminal domain-containing protein [Thermodesulfobacteriota bacterium]|nr:Rho termination factor N-terminal domain-containing protein [Thermodesulfobacteriota bacterium]
MMEFFLVDVKSIMSSVSLEKIDKAKVEKLADSILECEGLVRPLLLKPTGPESYIVVEGDMEYHAALKAREKNPRKGEMVNAFVISPSAEQAIFRQLKELENFLPLFSSYHEIKSGGKFPVNEGAELIHSKILQSLQKELTNILSSLPSQLTRMMQQMEISFQTLINERLTQWENRSQAFLNEQLTQWENKIFESARQTVSVDEIQTVKKDIENKTIAELKVLAKAKKIKGYSRMRKAELVDALTEA